MFQWTARTLAPSSCVGGIRPAVKARGLVVASALSLALIHEHPRNRVLGSSAALGRLHLVQRRVEKHAERKPQIADAHPDQCGTHAHTFD